MRFRLPRWLLCSLLAPITLGIIFVCGHVNNALLMSGVEGSELSQALLLANHPDAFTQTGEKQPAFYVHLLSSLFGVFGHDATPARLLTLISTAAMIVALGWLLHQEIGGMGLVCLGAFLCTTNALVDLSMTAVSNQAAISWAIIAVAISYNSIHPPNKKNLLLSGVIWAFAIYINFTALLLWPAYLVLCARQWGWKSAARSGGFWIIGFAATFILIAVLISSPPNLNPLFGSETRSEWAQMPLLLHTLLLNPGLLVAFVLGVLLMAQRKCSGPLLFAAIWLVSTLIWTTWRGGCTQPDVIQLYMPLIILASAGISMTVTGAMKKTAPSSEDSNHGPHHGRDLYALGAVTVFAFWAGFAVPNFVSGLKQLNHLPDVRHDGLCSSIRKYAPETHWCYTRFPSYAFAGGVVLPPEITAVSASVYSTNAPWETVFQLVQRYQPDQMLLEVNGEMRNKSWAAWTTNHYVLVDRDGEKELWVSRRLHPAPIQSPNDFLNKLGL